MVLSKSGFRTILTGLGVVYFFSVAIPVNDARAASGIVPHRAFYTLSLDEKYGAGVINDVDGVMVLSMEQTCDGWIYTQDLKTIVTPTDGDPVNQSAFFTSWEAANGLEYRFASKYLNNGDQSILRGTAVLNADGSGGSAHYSKPSSIDIDLPEGTMFPIFHTIRLLDEARSGSRYFSRIVFTGTEDFKPELVNAFIGDVVKSSEHGTGKVGELGEQVGWPLSLAFYPLVSDTGVPSFQMSVMQLDNGVSSSMVMDFGTFATKITAEKIEAIDRPDC